MNRWRWILGAALLLVLAGALFTSAFPDGVESVARTLGFAPRESPVLTGSPLAGYQARFFRSPWAAQTFAGVVGVVLLYWFGVLFSRALKRKK